jgi:small-conductance mechanosensitive channel
MQRRAARRRLQSIAPNSFSALGADLWNRLTTPLLNFTYWTHLLIGVCFYGAIGVWTEVLRRFLLGAEEGNGNVLLAMHTFYPAIIGATAMQIMLNKDAQTYMRSFGQLVSTVFFIMAAVCILAATNIGESLSFRLAGIGISAAILFWWTANALDEGLKDVDPANATGGPLPPESERIADFPTGDAPVETAMGAVKL